MSAESRGEIDPVVSLELPLGNWRQFFAIARLAWVSQISETEARFFASQLNVLQGELDTWQKLQDLMGNQGLCSFPPLEPGHPAIGIQCSLCSAEFVEDDTLALLPIRPYGDEAERKMQEGQPHTAECELVHEQCLKQSVEAMVEEPQNQ